jgi:hypothetical protein
MTAIAMYLVGATLSVATPNTSYVHSSAQRSTQTTTVANREQQPPERRMLSLNGRGQYWHSASTFDERPATPATAHSFLSLGK